MYSYALPDRPHPDRGSGPSPGGSRRGPEDPFRPPRSPLPPGLPGSGHILPQPEDPAPGTPLRGPGPPPGLRPPRGRHAGGLGPGGRGSRLSWAAFLLGFATHGALDRAAHPYIVHGSGWTEPGKPETERFRGCHAFLERILDTLLWERRRGAGIAAFDAGALLCPPGEPPAEFPERITSALRRAYPSETAGDPRLPVRVANALADTRRFLLHTNPAQTSSGDGRGTSQPEAARHLRGPHGPRIISVIYPEVFDRDIDWAAERGRTWVHPCRGEPERRESFFELCEAAESEAAGVLRFVLDGFRSRSVPPGLSDAAGNGTLNVGDPEGRPARPRFRDPLPLYEAMAEELRVRLSR
ncbi:MAG: zinc dependent phospholipase C family protein [Desulfobacterales bacterium]|nr:zinc dependent phospholipase C family protein [Desulfobacterales bacterium]